MKENDHIKGLFNEKLKGFEADVPDSVWNRIDASLSQNSAPVFVKKQQNRTKIIKWTATVASIAAMIALLFVLTDIDKSQDVPLKQFVETKTNTGNNPSQETIETLQPKIEELYTEERPVSKRTGVRQDKSVPAPSIKNENYINESGDIVEPIVDVVEIASDQDQTTETNRENRAESIARYEKEILGQEQQSAKLVSDAKTNSGFSLSLNSRSNFALLNTVETARAEGGSYLPQLYTKKEEVEFRHYQPIALGVSVSKEIFRDVRAEIGVSYIYATSRVKAKPNEIFDLDDRQVFHYVSLPVSISYRFAEANKFKFQFSLGGSVQKDFYGLVKGKVTMEGLMDPKMTKKRELEQDNPQFSVNATLGASYPLYKKLHVYSKVGWAYYFDAKNQYQTIYSDRPHQLDLNVGLRFDF